MNWTTIGLSSLSGIDWCLPENLVGADPYLVWGDATGFVGSMWDSGKKLIPIVIELKNSVTIAELAIDEALLQIPPAYRVGQEPAWLTAQIHATSLPSLLKNKVRFVLGAARSGRYNRIGQAGNPPSIRTTPVQPLDVGTLSDFSALRSAEGSALESSEAHAALPPLIGVIDDACAFANQSFVSPGLGTRVVHLWDQHGLGNAPHEFGYGREYDHDDLQALIHAAGGDEAKCYPRDGVFGGPAPRRLHGTGVLDVLAGNVPVKNRMSGQATFTPDIASTSPVVFVQLQHRAFTGGTTGSMAFHVLDALTYILKRAQENQRVVVNLSYGMMAGSHDGTSMVESAVYGLLEQNKNLTVVTAAGNGQQWQAHAAGDSCKFSELTVQVLPDDPTETYVEIWLSKGDVSDLKVTLTGPDGLSGIQVGIGGLMDDLFRSGIVVTKNVPNGGGRGHLVLVCLGPTRIKAPTRSGRSASPHGKWTILLESKSEFSYDAWIERDDVPYSPAHRMSGSFFCAPSPVTPEGTLSTLANLVHDRFVVVGAVDALGSMVTEYTAAGGTRVAGQRVNGPDYVSWGEESALLRGLPVSGVRSGDVVRLTGTSVATPLVARAILNNAMPKALGPPGPRPQPPVPSRGGRVANADELRRGQHSIYTPP